ncbi:Plant protein of unknown function [Forsythia ovata]|uniref:Uncharacterized protein n=1 Tax=Forsythia ovata TaxID=205694 RepID=A0ABD1PL33_9LAMI
MGIKNLSSDGKQSNRSITRDEWLISIDKYIEGQKPKIERIPSMLREIESNKQCYEPLVVSIGPYHHGKQELQALEKLKIRFAQQFHQACVNQVSSVNQVSINDLCAKVAEVAGDARKCYEEDSETKKIDEESFIRMMFLDGCFILQYMYILTDEKGVDQLQSVKSSNLLFVWRDLFLLENQIPILILKVLLEFRFKSKQERTDLFNNFFELMRVKPPEESSCINEVNKFVVKYCPVNVPKGKNQETLMNWEESPHLLDLMRANLIGSSGPGDKKPDSTADYWCSYRSVTELGKSGIHFRASETTNFTDVDFKSYYIYGKLMLPPIVVDDTTKPLLLNLAAYEMSPHGPSELKVASYICLMDSLIDHAEDVKELRKKGILLNNLGSDEQLAHLFNEIANQVVLDPLAYADVKNQIEKLRKNKVAVWATEGLHNHFTSPWTFSAFLGAILVLVLTAIQSYVSVFPRSSSPH